MIRTLAPHRAIARLSLCAFLLVTGCAGIGRPAPKPDLSTAQSAAAAYLKAIQRGDADTAHAASVGDRAQQQWVDGLATMVDGMRRFDAAVYQRFGNRAGQMHVDLIDALHAVADEPVELLRDSKTVVNGAVARVDPPRKGFTSHFQNTLYLRQGTDGAWRVDLLKTYADQVPPERLADVSANFRHYEQFGQVFRDTGDGVKAGRFKTLADAQRVLGERMAQVRQPEG